MKKLLLLLLVVAISISMVVSFSLSGCKKPAVEEVAEEEVVEEEVVEEEVVEEERVIKVGYTPPVYDPADFHGQFESGIMKGLDEAGVKYEVYMRSPKDHVAHEQQLAIVEDFITAGVDYIVINPTEYTAQVTSYEKVNESGIPLFIGNYSDPFPEEWGVEALIYSGYSDVDGGLATANFIVENYPKGTKIAIIQGGAGEKTENRAQKELHIKNGMDVIYEHYADYDRTLAYDATERLLMAHPDTEIIIACSSMMAIGCIEAIEVAGLTGEIDVFGAGGTIEELLAIEAGTLKGCWMRDPVSMGEAVGKGILMCEEGREDEIDPVFNSPIYMLDSIGAINKYVNPITYESQGYEFPRPTK